MPQRLPTPSFHPAIGHSQHPTLSSQSLACRSAPQEQHHQFTPPPNNSADTLDPGDIESVPKPDNLSQKNLRAEMGLDHAPEATMYYNKIRVGALMEPLYLLTCYASRTLSVDT